MDTLLQIGLSNAVLATGLAVLAGLAQLCRCRPALVHGLCLLVLLKLVSPPLVSVPVTWTPATENKPVAPASTAAEPAPADEIFLVEVDWSEPSIVEETAPIVAAEATPPASFPWFLLVGGAWLTGSVFCLILAGVRIRRFTALLRHSQPAPPDLQAQVETLARQLGLKSGPSTWLVPGALSPMLWSWGQPRLLLPAELWGRVDDDGRATLLVHELAHLLRRDHWVRALELTATALYWWHPVLWWARGRLHDAEEHCCDAWVIWALPSSGRAYAQALLETIDFLSGARRALPPVASAAGQFPVLKRRLTMILQGTTPRRLSTAGMAGVLGLAMLLPLVPTLAQAEPPADVLRERPDPAQREKHQKEIGELTRELERLHAELAKVHERLRELGGGDFKFKMIRFSAPIEGGERGVRVPPQPVPGAPGPDVLFLRGGAGPELVVLKAQFEVKKAQVKEAEVLLQNAKEKAGRARSDDEKQDLQQEVRLRAAQLEGRQAEMKEAEARLAQAQAHGQRFEMEVKPFHIIKGAAGVRVGEVQPNPRPTPPTPQPAQGRAIESFTRPLPPPAGGDRTQELEKKLDILMRELESLRKDLKR